MSSLWGVFGVDALAEQARGAVTRASEMAKDVLADDIDDEDDEVLTARALQATAGERDEAREVQQQQQHLSILRTSLFMQSDATCPLRDAVRAVLRCDSHLVRHGRRAAARQGLICRNRHPALSLALAYSLTTPCRPCRQPSRPSFRSPASLSSIARFLWSARLMCRGSRKSYMRRKSSWRGSRAVPDPTEPPQWEVSAGLCSRLPAHLHTCLPLPHAFLPACT
jgi:hypothetical protein